jgi:hypothetical protein
MDLSFRVYCDGANLVTVVFPEDGGSAILRDSHPLSGLGLAAETRVPPHHETPYGTYTGSKKDLQRGGVEVEINYEEARIVVTPHSHISSLDSKSYVCTFEDIGIRDARETDIRKAKSTTTLQKTLDAAPLSDETWP